MNHANEMTKGIPISALLSRVAESVGKLVSDHLRLTRMELTDDARAMASRTVVVVCFALVIVVGYALLCAAVAMLAGRWITPVGGWLLVGAINLIVGGIGLKVALAKLIAASARP
jgi:hypothetical protein